MDPLALYYPEQHEGHVMFGHPERPERVEAVKKGLEETGLWNAKACIAPFPPSRDLLEAVHTKEYLQLLESACQQGRMLDPDTYTTQQSWQLALNAAGGGIAICDQVWDRKAATGLALTRPPGHHATRNRGMGFCLINNVALAAEYLLREKGARKVAIIDLDLHHGNGTQDIFWESSQVTYISIHQAPFYPGTGAIHELGKGEGEGSTLNLPIPSRSGDQAFDRLVKEIVLPYLGKQEPEMVLVSYGFDTHWRDPLGSMLTSASCIFRILQDLVTWCDIQCGGRLAVYLEGGYDLEAGSACGGAVGAALTGLASWQDPLGVSSEPEGDSWQQTLRDAIALHNLD